MAQVSCNKLLDLHKIRMSNILSVERIPALITVFSAVVLSISIIYDFGYLAYLGLSFSEVPTSLSDHIRSSLVWIPSTVIMLFGAMAVELLSRRIEQGMTEEELIKSSPSPKFTAWFRASPKYGFMALAVFIIFSPFIDLELPIQAWMLSFIVLWFMFHSFFFNHEKVLQRSSKGFYFASKWIPASIIFISLSGAVAAEKLQSDKKYVFEIGDTKKIAVLGRSYENYFLVWVEESNAVEFLSRSTVKAFYQIQVKESKKLTNTDNHKAVADS